MNKPLYTYDASIGLMTLHQLPGGAPATCSLHLTLPEAKALWSFIEARDELIEEQTLRRLVARALSGEQR